MHHKIILRNVILVVCINCPLQSTVRYILYIYIRYLNLVCILYMTHIVDVCIGLQCNYVFLIVGHSKTLWVTEALKAKALNVSLLPGECERDGTQITCRHIGLQEEEKHVLLLYQKAGGEDWSKCRLVTYFGSRMLEGISF